MRETEVDINTDLPLEVSLLEDVQEALYSEDDCQGSSQSRLLSGFSPQKLYSQQTRQTDAKPRPAMTAADVPSSLKQHCPSLIEGRRPHLSCRDRGRARAPSVRLPTAKNKRTGGKRRRRNEYQRGE